jgi:uncharacterized membrane protein YgcG
MPTDLTDWIAIIVAALLGLAYLWEYRRLARRWPRRRRRIDHFDSDDAGDGGGDGDGGGEDGGGGDGGGGDGGGGD